MKTALPFFEAHTNQWDGLTRSGQGLSRSGAFLHRPVYNPLDHDDEQHAIFIPPTQPAHLPSLNDSTPFDRSPEPQEFRSKVHTPRSTCMARHRREVNERMRNHPGRGGSEQRIGSFQSVSVEIRFFPEPTSDSSLSIGC